MAFDSDGNMFAGNNGVGGLFYSTEKGQNAKRVAWTSIGFGYPEDIEIDNNKVIILNKGQNSEFTRSIYISIDGPDTTFSESIYGNLSSTYFDADNYDANIKSVYYTGSEILAACDKGVFVNSDLSQNWERRGNVQDVECSYIQGNIFGEIFLATDEEGIFKSLDNGKNWNYLDGTKEIFNKENKVNEIKFNNNKIYLISKKGIYYSDLEDIKFNKISGIDYNVTEIEFFNDIIYFAPEWGSLKKLKNGEITELPSNTSFSQVNKFLEIGDFVYAANDIGQIFKSSNEGNSWELLDIGLEVSLDNSITSLDYTDNELFIGTKNNTLIIYNLQNNSSKIIRTNFQINKVLKNAENIWAATDKGLFFSQDKGNSWSLAHEQSKEIRIKTMDFYNEDLIFGTTNSGFMIYSPTNKLLEPLNNKYNNHRTFAFLIVEDKLYAGVEAFGGLFSGLVVIDLITKKSVESNDFANPVFPKSSHYPTYLSKDNQNNIIGFGRTSSRDVFVKLSSSNNFIRHKLSENFFPPLVKSSIITDSNIWVSYEGFSEAYVLDISLFDFIKNQTTKVESDKKFTSDFSLKNNTLTGTVYSNTSGRKTLNIYNLLGEIIYSKNVNLINGENIINLNINNNSKLFFIELDGHIYKVIE